MAKNDMRDKKKSKGRKRKEKGGGKEEAWLDDCSLCGFMTWVVDI
jgi:hypothetical protein